MAPYLGNVLKYKYLFLLIFLLNEVSSNSRKIRHQNLKNNNNLIRIHIHKH